MVEKSQLKSMKESLESLPVFVVMDFLYGKNENSPIALSKSTKQKYSELVQTFKSTMSAAMQQKKIESPRQLPFTALFSISEMILYSLTKQDDLMRQVMAPVYVDDQYCCHGINVAVLTSKIGMGLGLEFNELCELCVAALLHDIGMTQLNPELWDHNRTLSNGERRQLEEHPEMGHRLLKKLEKDFPWLLRVIREEHQRSDGKGYPYAEEEDTQHLYSRVVAVSDAFEALTHSRSFRKAYHPGDAVKIILDGKASHFDAKVLRAMLDSLSLFPVGSLVQLNTKAIAEVVASVQSNPIRPVIQVVSTKEGGDTKDGQVINLSEETSLFVSGLVYDDRYFVPENARNA